VHGFFEDGDFSNQNGRERIDFFWEGNDEMDEAKGRGWLMIKSENEVEMYLKHGDKMKFLARRGNSSDQSLMD